MLDFNELVEKAHAEDSSIEDKDNLWGHLFSLEAWFFIPRGEGANMYPFIASSPDIADEQFMIRAFTDTDKLYNFAKANDLLDEGGKAMVLSIPVANAFEYLAQFEEYSYGIWFNSDPDSLGFYAPLQQISFIKNHIDNNWAGAKKERENTEENIEE